MDGYVTIGTKLDTSGIDKGIQEVQRKIDRLKDKATIETIGLNEGARVDTNLTEQEQEYLSRLYTTLGNLQQEKDRILQTDNQIVEAVQQQALAQNTNSSNIVATINGINYVKKSTEELNQETKKIDFSGIKKSIDSVGNSVEKVTKKVTRWALAIFGIRSAYLFIRQSMSTLSQYDDQMAVNVEWIRYLLANALKPVIEEIINLVYRLLTYINYIAQAWFGVNLFASASLKAFQKQQKAMSGSAKKAKELQKTIAGFDEMNVLQDNKDTGAGGGAGGASLPSFPKMEDVDIPAWVKWIADNGELLASILLGIASAIVAIKLGAEGMMALGIGIIVAGIVLLIQDVIKFLKDPSWEGFINILGDIAIIIGGIMLLMGNWWGLLVVIVGSIVKLVIDNWDTIAGVLGTIGNWINTNVIQPVVSFFTGMWNKLKTGAQNAWNGIKSVFSTVASFFKNTFTNAWNAVKKVFSTGGKVFTGIKDGILNAFKKIVNTLIDGINKIIKIPFDGINTALKKIKNINILGQKPFKGLISTISVPKIPKLAKGGVINNPGKGVYTGSAIAGEAGREFYMPLQDEQMLSLVGEAIGRYVNINLTNITQLDGRQIARKVEQISNNNRFVLNR